MPQKKSKSFIIAIVTLFLCASVSVASLCFAIAAFLKNDGGIVGEFVPPELYSSLAKEYRNNVVELENGTAAGTGFVYTFDNQYMYIVSNFHVTGAVSEFLSIRFSGRSAFEKEILQLIGYDKHYDVAVLRTDKFPALPYVDLKKENKLSFTPEMGSVVFSMGNALGKGVQAAGGIVSKESNVLHLKEMGATADAKGRALLTVSAPFNSGMSGSAVFDAKGNLAGMHTWKEIYNASDQPVDNICYSVPAPVIDAIFCAVKNLEESFLSEPFSPSFPPNFFNRNDSTWKISAGMNALNASLYFEDGKLKVKSVDALETQLVPGDEISVFGQTAVSPFNYSILVGELYRYATNGNGDPLTLKIKRGGLELTVFEDGLKRL